MQKKTKKKKLEGEQANGTTSIQRHIYLHIFVYKSIIAKEPYTHRHTLRQIYLEQPYLFHPTTNVPKPIYATHACQRIIINVLKRGRNREKKRVGWRAKHTQRLSQRALEIVHKVKALFKFIATK